MRRSWIASVVAILLFGWLFTSTLAYALCGTDVVIVTGRVEHPPSHARVRVQLVYTKPQHQDAAETTLEAERFTIQVPFFTQSRAPVFNGSLFEKCDRKPKAVVVTLLGGGQHAEYDRVSLDLISDFKMSDPSAYVLRSEVVLSGAR
jgi:hypothetical protein